jgi:hypothetical protein
MTMRTVTLELLRHGPAHNQLLSPLTPYLALCGNHPPETVHVGLEQIQISRYIRQLRYEGGLWVAAHAVQDAAREVSRLLESIRSLTAEMATSDPQESQRMIHLRLVLSASELAMLPFELATAHSAMPGQGHPISLQTETPVCLTREVRRVAANTFQWPEEPRILMVSAAPGNSDVPTQKHREKLEAALAPYVDIADPEELGERLTVIEKATLEKVREACAQRAYTHVHILAHGTHPTVSEDETRYGLAFHSQADPNKADVVSGERLASALRCHLRTVNGKQVLSSPAVVSIASCDSANVGNVVAPGASIAHVLHEEGIPLVIGSQFLLSKEGSVTMAEVLYRRLIEGDDPRTIVHDVRQALHTGHPLTHDWAALVVYAAFPSSLQSQIRHARFEMEGRALNLVMNRAEDVILPMTDEALAGHDAASPRTANRRNQPLLRETQQQLMDAMTRFEETMPDGGGVEQVKAWGVLAAAWKQIGVFLSLEVSGSSETELRSSNELLQDTEFRTVLEKARSYYYRIYQTGAVEAWPLVQYLALTIGLRLHKTLGTSTAASTVSRTFKRLWGAAVVRAEDNLRWGRTRQKAWAHGSLLELALMSMLWRDPMRCRAEAFRHLYQAIDIWSMSLEEDALFDADSLDRQLFLYDFWDWGSKDISKLSKELSNVIRERMPSP